MIEKIEVPIIQTNSGLIPKTSTVDFVGIYPQAVYDQITNEISLQYGQGIAFDAKETEKKTSIPLSNIKQHQLVYLEYFKACAGTAFFLIHFKTLHPDHAFVTPVEFIRSRWDGKRRSIQYKDFDKNWLVAIDDYLQYFIQK